MTVVSPNLVQILARGIPVDIKHLETIWGKEEVKLALQAISNN
jgi:hypothetical protein